MLEMDIDQLKLRYRGEEDAAVRERILMILWLKSGVSSYEVGERLFCPQSKVIYWKKRYQASGIDGLRSMQKSGRPNLMDAAKEDEIREELSSKDHWKSSQISQLVEERSGIRYTQRHVRRLMQKWGYALITPRKKHRNAASDNEISDFKKTPQKYWVLSGKE